MKKKSTPVDLLQLVRSMSKAEKRAFRLDSTRYKTTEAAPKSYLLLYDQLQRVQDESELEEVGTSDQEYLFALLTSSLVKQRSSPEIELREQLSIAELLHRRGLEKRAQRLFTKLMEQAETACLFEFGLEVAGLCLRLLKDVEQLEQYDSLLRYRSRMLRATTRMHQFDEFVLNLFQLSKNDDLDSVRESLRDPLLTVPGANIAEEVERLHVEAQAAFIVNEIERMEACSDRIAELFIANPQFLEVRTEQYLTLLFNNGQLAYQLRKPDRLAVGIQQLRNLQSVAISTLQVHEKERQARYLLDLQFRAALLTESATSDSNLLLAATTLLRNDKKIELYRSNYLRYFAALMLYRAGSYREALRWLQPVIDNQRHGFYNRKTFALSSLLRAACHYQQGNADVGDAQLLSFRRNSHFAQTRVKSQFQALIPQIREGYKGPLWLL